MPRYKTQQFRVARGLNPQTLSDPEQEAFSTCQDSILVFWRIRENTPILRESPGTLNLNPETQKIETHKPQTFETTTLT